MKFWAIFLDTFREARDKWMVVIFGIITILFAAFYLIVIKVEKVDDNNVTVGVVFDDRMMPPMDAREFVTNTTASFMMLNAMIMNFLFIIAFAFFIPNMLKPGNLDLHLSKPLYRPQLLLYKFFSCVLSVFVLLFGITTIIWMILCFKAGTWTFDPFIYVFLFPIVFGIAFSILVFCSVLTRGAGAGIAFYFIYAFIIEGLLVARDQFKMFIRDEWFAHSIDFLYNISPKISESLNVVGKYSLGQEVESWFPLWSSVFFAAGLLTLSCVIFSKKDY